MLLLCLAMLLLWLVFAGANRHEGFTGRPFNVEKAKNLMLAFGLIDLPSRPGQWSSSEAAAAPLLQLIAEGSTRPGAISEAVYNMQRFLRVKGLYTGKPDGNPDDALYQQAFRAYTASLDPSLVLLAQML